MYHKGLRESRSVPPLLIGNVLAIKIWGACTLSHQPFPYPEIWEPLGQIFNAFGFGRRTWGTGWPRAVNLLTYEFNMALLHEYW